MSTETPRREKADARQQRNGTTDLPPGWTRDADPEGIPALAFEHDTGTRVEIWREAPVSEQVLRADRFSLRWHSGDDSGAERIEDYCHDSVAGAVERAHEVIREHQDAQTEPATVDEWGVPR